MGLFKNIISNAISEGISKGISNAVSSSAEKAIKPVTERPANETAGSINSAAETMKQYSRETEADKSGESVNTDDAVNNQGAADIFSTVLADFPKWTYTAVKEVSTSEEDEYLCVMVAMKLTDDFIEEYQEVLSNNGFTGNWQIMEKQINGKTHKIDFTFVSDEYINYYIFN